MFGWQGEGGVEVYPECTEIVPREVGPPCNGANQVGVSSNGAESMGRGEEAREKGFVFEVEGVPE